MIYRSKFIISFAHVLLVFSIVILIKDGLSINYTAFLFALLFCLLATLGMVRFYKITITHEGLRGYDFWGIYHTINWKGIIKVTPVRIVGLKYIKIKNEDSSRPLWIPLFLNDMDGFIKEVKGRLEADNPLKLYLQTEKNA